VARPWFPQGELMQTIEEAAITPLHQRLDYLKEKYDGLLAIQFDIVPRIMSLFSKGYIVGNDGKIRPALESKNVEVPWIYVRHNDKLTCKFSTEVLFQTLGIFPRSCMDCWKVVVRPRNIKELIMLLELQEEYCDYPCKCGIERRDHVPALYGGYFYCNGKKEGLDRLDQVRELVHYHISPEVPVTLKRYCTEFELKFGPSDQLEETLLRGYYMHPDQGRVPVMQMGQMQIWQAAAGAIIDVEADFSRQPDWLKQHVIAEFYKWAWKYDKKNAEFFLGNKPLYTPSKTYERGAVTEDLDNEIDEEITMEIAEAHHELYEMIPSFECEPGCNACCGTMQEFSAYEWSQVKDKKFPAGNRCPYISPEGCTIYEQRPLVCRLFGNCSDMLCPKGFGPEKPLSEAVASNIMVQYNLMRE